MNEWHITTQSGVKVVRALEASITPGGDLVFKIQDGCVQQVFAKGAWTECILVTTAQHGYTR